MAVIRLEKVAKTFYDKKQGKTVHAVYDFDLEIQDKEFLVLVGPSGCGKTTTLRMVAGLEEISSGKLYMDGKVVNDLPSQSRDIAMVFQNYALYPHLTVRENLGFSLKLRGIRKSEISKKVEEVAQILRLHELLERLPKQLSGGQAQRVAIGRAIVRNPKVFLFDEPLSNLDAKMRVDMRVELSKLHKALNATIIYVTHDQVEAMTLADRIVVMNKGYIQQIGAPMELYQRPTNRFVGSFIGSPTMNQEQVTVQLVDGKTMLVGNGFTIPLTGTKAESAVSEYVDKKIWIGIRSEDLIPTNDADTRFTLKRKVEVIETLGNDTYIYFSINPDNTNWVAEEGGEAQAKKLFWVARCSATNASFKEGETIPIAVNIENIHIFSSDGSKRLA